MKTMEKILMSLLIVTLIVPLSYINQANQIVDIESEKDAIQNVVNAHFKYMDSYDLDNVLTLQTEDILEMPPNVPPLVGKDGYAGHLKSWLDYSKTLKNNEMSFPVSEFVLTGNWKWARVISNSTKPLQ